MIDNDFSRLISSTDINKEVSEFILRRVMHEAIRNFS